MVNNGSRYLSITQSIQLESNKFVFRLGSNKFRRDRDFSNLNEIQESRM